MLTNNEVLNFISRFTGKGHKQEVIDSFTCGCCYWFATILQIRFPSSEIMYDSISNHFGTRVDTIVYDITGDVTNNYQWQLWSDFDDETEYKRILRDCINF